MPESNSMFNNNQLLQFLLAGGQDLMTYGADTGKGLQFTNLAGAALGNIKAKNVSNMQQKWLQYFLSGAVPGGKMTMDDKGFKFDVPKGAFGVDSSLAPAAPSGSPTGMNAPAFNLGGGANATNPFVTSLPEFSASDLAGLTPEDISGALGGALNVEALRGKRASDVFEMMLKGEKFGMEREAHPIDIRYKKALTAESEARAAAETPSIDVDVDGTKIKMSPKDYIAYQKMNKEEKTAAVKNYEYAQTGAGGGFKGSFTEFQDAAKSAHQKDYEGAVAGGYKGSFNTWMLDMRKAGATNISLGTKLEEKKAMSELEGQLYFNDPKWTGDLGKHLSSEDIQNELFRSDNPKQMRAEETVKFIEDKITAGGGTIQEVAFDKDGKTMIWKVKWPSGDTKEIRYAVRP